ncbi:OadG family transporter subunit [Halanaerobium kushneri]|uniref:Sodium pump decarboxylases, gamma subunit n=1 Tax=Halanaerobium kushneri TaxID=56779 RepID=A0A1N7AAS5_9FIRM|nr:OadG family transporter subunit [Halanaerobium kushneri]SIR36215.1 sodium pump decarboxylases, gamma subunit [Halanaerobium kushneri]
MNVLGETLEITVIGLSVVFLVLLLLTIILKLQGWLMEKFFLKSKKETKKQVEKEGNIAKTEKKKRAVIAAAIDSYLKDHPAGFTTQEGRNMQKYKIKIDDEIYEVEVELVDEGNNIKSINKSNNQSKSKFSTISKDSNSTTDKQSAAKKRAAQIKSKEKSRTSSVSEDDELEIKAPMPGQILMLAVTEGEEVQEGQHLAVLEAMKMENDITAPKDGVIKEVCVKEGKEVNSGDNLFILN